MSDNTVLPSGAGGDTIRTIDRVTAKTQVIALDVGGEPGSESIVTGANPLPVVHPTLDAAQYDDDGIPYVNPNVPGADIATGDKQTQQLLVLQQIAMGAPVSQQGPWTVAVSAQPTPVLAPNATQETSGQLQRVADLMEAVLVELRTISTILVSLGQSVPEDPDRVRNDINLNLG